MRTWMNVLFFAAIGSLVLNGCGDDGDDGGPAGPGTSTGAATTSTLAVSAGSHAIPLTNGRAVHVADVPVTIHVADGSLVATRWETSPATVTISTGTRDSTLAGRGSQLLAAWVGSASRQVMASESSDGGRTWGGLVALGSTGAGPAVPTACVYMSGATLRRIVVWSDMPGPSNGPLRVAMHDGTRWLAETTYSTAASAGAALYCPDNATPELIWRDDREGSGRSALRYGTVSADGGIAGDMRIIQPGFDPSYCGSGNTRWAGFHTGTNDTHLARASAGWSSHSEVDADTSASGNQIDDTGKFASVSCEGNVIALAWGDWPGKSDAASASDATRRLGLIVSRDGGTTWQNVRPAGEETQQGPAGTAVSGSIVYVVWKAPGAIKLARVP